MCDVCGDRRLQHDFVERPSRRSALIAGASTVAAIVTGGGAAPALASSPAEPSVSADEALKRLIAGNEKFVASPQTCTLDMHNRRTTIASRQAPWATIIGCADSRVPPELLFGGLGLGELFVTRNAGNLADTAVLGTVEYGALHLGSRLIVVLGHERCGAVAAACDVALKGTKHPGSIGKMIAPIVPIAHDVRGRKGDFVDNTIRESARRTARRLTEMSDPLTELVDDKLLKIVAARYDLDSGRVEFLK